MGYDRIYLEPCTGGDWNLGVTVAAPCREVVISVFKNQNEPNLGYIDPIQMLSWADSRSF